MTVSSCVGVSLAPEDGIDPDALLGNAQLALNRARLEGRGRRCFFEIGVDARAKAKRILELDLRAALAADEFELHYQPLLNLASGKITGAEALLRWKHPHRGWISPVDFIPLAEETGLIGDLGAWVLHRACREAATWPEDLTVAVNISAVQCRDASLANVISAALTESGLPPKRLELEITETALLTDDNTTVDLLQQLRRLGARISLDDFGTGYSSLSHLRAFPFEKIKIDRSFVQEIGVDKNT
jgi:predicted signal transduction protein with EAL and GGDEF domain